MWVLGNARYWDITVENRLVIGGGNETFRAGVDLKGKTIVNWGGKKNLAGAS